MERMWIDLDGLVNLRDVGGISTAGGAVVKAGRLLRSDNLQDLTGHDIERLLALGLTDVIDLRSDFEATNEGPGPLIGRPEVQIHAHSLFREWRDGVGEDKPDVRPETLPDEALPWVDLTPSVRVDNPVASYYLSYVADRPDSVLAALRAVGQAKGAALVHCAAGKDRTGTIVALALSLAGADREAIAEDYAASSERMEQIVGRLLNTRTYADNLRDRPMSTHMSYPDTMLSFLEYVDETYGGVEPLLNRAGWTSTDTVRLRRHLLG